MLQVRPTRDNPIYVEWKKWFYECKNQFNNSGHHNYTLARKAMESIERIAEFIYGGQNDSIVGTMIMMKDTEEMEQEGSVTSGER